MQYKQYNMQWKTGHIKKKETRYTKDYFLWWKDLSTVFNNQ